MTAYKNVEGDKGMKCIGTEVGNKRESSMTIHNGLRGNKGNKCVEI